MTGFDMTIWNGFYAPRGTPKPIRDKLHAALQKFLDDPVIIDRFAQTGTVPFGKAQRSPEAHRKLLDADIAPLRHDDQGDRCEARGSQIGSAT